MKNKFESYGSYIIIQPISFNDKTHSGKVIFKNEYRRFSVGDKVLYHEDDFKNIKIDDVDYHAVYWYNILLRESSEKEESISTKLKFTGADADF